MSAAFTPGPWRDNLHAGEKREGGRFCVHVFAKSAGIVPVACVPTGVEGYGREEGRANARLIAAAPKLYDGCNALIGLLDLILHRDDLPVELGEAILASHRLHDAQNAVAEARGEQSL